MGPVAHQQGWNPHPALRAKSQPHWTLRKSLETFWLSHPGTGIQWVETRDTAKHQRMHSDRPHNAMPIPNVECEIKKPPDHLQFWALLLLTV